MKGTATLTNQVVCDLRDVLLVAVVGDVAHVAETGAAWEDVVEDTRLVHVSVVGNKAAGLVGGHGAQKIAAGRFA